MCVSSRQTFGRRLRHPDHPQLCCPLSGPHSLPQEGHPPGQLQTVPGFGTSKGGTSYPHAYTQDRTGVWLAWRQPHVYLLANPCGWGWAAVNGSVPRTQGSGLDPSHQSRGSGAGRVHGSLQQLPCTNHCAKYLLKQYSQNSPEAEAHGSLPQ